MGVPHNSLVLTPLSERVASASLTSIVLHHDTVAFLDDGAIPAAAVDKASTIQTSTPNAVRQVGGSWNVPLAVLWLGASLDQRGV